MDGSRERSPVVAAGVLLGLGLGGFFDGIVLHQLLQWHHMVSSVEDYPVTTVAGLEANTLGDGLFDAATWLFTVAGLALLWRALRRTERPWSTRVLVGSFLVGWGLFNLVEGFIDHHLLQIHHVIDLPTHEPVFDWVFLAVGGAGLLALGATLMRPRARRVAV